MAEPASIFALTNLYQVVSQSFVAESVPAVNVFGWRVPAQHPYGNRITWIPGDPTGAVGVTGPTRNPGGYPRSLGTLHELFTVLINGQDLTDPENELAQYDIVRRLRDAWYRAVYRAAHGAFAVRYEEWDLSRVERRHGAALRIVCEIEATIPDIPFSLIPPWAQVPPPVSVDVGITMLDLTEHLIVSSGHVEDVFYADEHVTYLGENVTTLVLN